MSMEDFSAVTINTNSLSGATVWVNLRSGVPVAYSLDAGGSWFYAGNYTTTTSEGGGGNCNCVSYIFSNGLSQSNNVIKVDTGTQAGQIVSVRSNGKIAAELLPMSTQFSIDSGGLVSLDSNALLDDLNDKIDSVVDKSVSRAVELQFSEDLTTWTDEQLDTSVYYRWRYTGGSAYSEPITLVAGPTGPVGERGPQGPKGDQGERGAAFTIDATGTLAELSNYNGEAAGFSFLATDNGCIYIKNSDEADDWSNPIPFKGDPGENGLDGVDGVDGKSAYQISVDNGFEGGESAWLASLKGADGVDGSDGITPVKGEDYFTEAEITEIINMCAEQVSAGLTSKAW